MIILFGFILDFIFGDPHHFPHPIRMIGKLISSLEKIFRKFFPKKELLAGFFLSVIVCAVCFALPYFILMWVEKINIYLRIAVESFFCYQILATKSLKDESMKVYSALEKNNISDARKYLSYIVGRDTQNLTETEIVKATVETVAENTSDAVIAPLFFLALGGAPLGFLYKAINTMDSMIGYQNEKYQYFGRTAAKLDDAANYIPARISAAIMILASFILRYNTKNAVKIFLRDRRNHKSPNSAYTEAACAGALEIQLAGSAYYFGELVEKPFIGDAIRTVEKNDIKKVNRLLYISALLALCIVLIQIRCL